MAATIRGQLARIGARWDIVEDKPGATKPNTRMLDIDRLGLTLDDSHIGRKASALLGIVNDKREVVAIAIAGPGTDEYPPYPLPVAAPTAANPAGARPVTPGPAAPRPAPAAPVARKGTPTHFVNSYGFVAPTPRQASDPAMAGLLRIGHGRYGEDLYSGCIPIRIQTRTPLLLPDHAHRRQIPIADADTGETIPLTVYPTRTDPHNRPLLDGSAVKGMLRSAFESVTSSRMGVFDHDNPLSMRTPVNQAIDTMPARVAAATGPRRTVVVTTAFKHPDARHRRPQTAVWVDFGRFGPLLSGTSTTSEMAKNLHGRQVYAWVYLLNHPPVGRQAAYDLWRVGSIAFHEKALTPPEQAPEFSPTARLSNPDLLRPVKVRGHLHWHGGMIGRKHDERLFVDDVLDNAYNDDPDLFTTETFDLDAEGDGAEVVRQWRGVIDSYAAAHAAERPLSPKLGLHIHNARTLRDLPEGTTFHVELDPTHRRITRVTPAMVGRDAYQLSPNALAAAANINPAATTLHLSDADWVFGWTAPGRDDARGSAGHRGHLRVDPPQLESPGDGAIDQSFRIPLATLNSPKEAQYRSYVRNPNGTPLAGTPRHWTKGFAVATPGRLPANQQLSGWKRYQFDRLLADPHSPDARTYWTPPITLHDHGDTNRIPHDPVTINGLQRYREYLAPDLYPPRVTQGIHGWVRPAVTFTTTLWIDNLTRHQLGALLWLLHLPDTGMHRLGFGKPLGFGVVRITLDHTAHHRPHLATGTGRRAQLSTLHPTDNRTDTTTLADEFAANTDIAAARNQFLTIAQGIDYAPVHSPRATPEPEKESYKWWKENEEPGHFHAIPLAGLDQRLPYLPAAR